jgi:hypothetical protein
LKVAIFNLSNDPRLTNKLVNFVGLYLDPSERAVVFSFDENPRTDLDRNLADRLPRELAESIGGLRSSSPSLRLTRAQRGEAARESARSRQPDVEASLREELDDILTFRRLGVSRTFANTLTTNCA